MPRRAESLAPEPADEPMDVDDEPAAPLDDAPLVEPVDDESDVDPLGDVIDPLADAPGVPMVAPVEVLPPAPLPEPTDALGLVDCASRLHASKSVCVGSAARAGPQMPITPATANSAVAQ
jgi:hypothetical protein